MPRGRPRLAKMMTIAEAAKEAGRPYLSFYRLIMGLHKQHGGAWLQRPPSSRPDGQKSGRREWRINMSLLVAAHPDFFEARFISRDEGEVILDRIAELDTHHQDQNQRFNRQAVVIRDLQARVKDLEKVNVDLRKSIDAILTIGT